MDNELIFRQAQSCETDRIMQIIRQAQAGCTRQAAASGRTAIRPGTYLGRHRPQPRLCIVQTRRGRPAFSDRLRRGGVRRRTGLRRHRRTMAHRRAVRAGAPHSGRRRGTGAAAWRRNSCTVWRHSHRNAASKPFASTPTSTTRPCCGCSNARDSPIAGKSSTGAANGWLTKNESENTPTQKTEPEAPLPGFFHFTVQRVTIFLKKSSRGTL